MMDEPDEYDSDPGDDESYDCCSVCDDPLDWLGDHLCRYCRGMERQAERDWEWEPEIEMSPEDLKESSSGSFWEIQE